MSVRLFGSVKLLGALVLIAFILLLEPPVQASSWQGFVEIRKDQKLFVDYRQPKNNESETILLLNGLTYETTSWDLFVNAMESTNYGILRYDPKGMGQTLQLDGPVKNAISIDQQAEDLHDLILKLQLPLPVNLVGLSYGGGLALVFAEKYPRMLKRAILLSPFTEPVKSQDQYIRSQIAANRMAFPLNPATDEELYSYYLRQMVYVQDPLVEPSILKSPLKPEAVFQMTQGIRKHDMSLGRNRLPPGSLYLVVAGMDQYIERQTFENFWSQSPAASRSSKMIIKYSEHKIPEAFPIFLSQWIDKIMKNDPKTVQQSQCEGDPFSHTLVCK